MVDPVDPTTGGSVGVWQPIQVDAAGYRDIVRVAEASGGGNVLLDVGARGVSLRCSQRHPNRGAK